MKKPSSGKMEIILTSIILGNGNDMESSKLANLVDLN
jgi:hypothetical protein